MLDILSEIFAIHWPACFAFAKFTTESKGEKPNLKMSC